MSEWPWQGVLGLVLIVGVFVFAFGELGWGGGTTKPVQSPASQRPVDEDFAALASRGWLIVTASFLGFGAIIMGVVAYPKIGMYLFGAGLAWWCSVIVHQAFSKRDQP